MQEHKTNGEELSLVSNVGFVCALVDPRTDTIRYVGKKRLEETKMRMSEAAKRRWARSKGVI